ncbi:hypothetical protein [Proteus mirabilis]|uniref:hypothetical protein n=1 Tax=Proteus mirabilis TaxID=584 RepID=UPI0034D420FE
MFQTIKVWLHKFFKEKTDPCQLCVETAMGSITTNLLATYDITEKKKINVETLNALDSLCDTANETFNKRLKLFDPTEDDIRNLDTFVQGLYNPVLFIDSKYNIRTVNKQFSRLLDGISENTLLGLDIRTFIKSNILDENSIYFRHILNATKSLTNGDLEYRPIQNTANLFVANGKKYGVSIRFSSYKFEGYDIVVMMEFTVLHESECSGRQNFDGNNHFIIR